MTAPTLRVPGKGCIEGISNIREYLDKYEEFTKIQESFSKFEDSVVVKHAEPESKTESNKEPKTKKEIVDKHNETTPKKMSLPTKEDFLSYIESKTAPDYKHDNRELQIHFLGRVCSKAKTATKDEIAEYNKVYNNMGRAREAFAKKYGGKWVVIENKIIDKFTNVDTYAFRKDKLQPSQSDRANTPVGQLNFASIKPTETLNGQQTSPINGKVEELTTQ